MKMLLEDLKTQNFKSLYLFCGEEAYLRNQYKTRLKQAFISDDDTMNFSAFEGKGCIISEIIGISDTLPFFAEHRFILIENSGFLKNKCDDLVDYLKNVPPSSHLLFVETEIDKRNRLYKLIKDSGRIVEFNAQDEKTLQRWILGLLQKEGKKITFDSLSLFLQKTGTDMEHIYHELEKLLSYCMDKDVIDSVDIETICITQTTNQIFEMIHCIATKNQQKALSLYYDLLALKEPPMRILFLIARQFQQLLLVKNLMEQGFDKNTIARKVGMAPFIVSKYMAQGKYFTSAQLNTALVDCVDTEEAVKTGMMNDRMSVELLIVKHSK